MSRTLSPLESKLVMFLEWENKPFLTVKQHGWLASNQGLFRTNDGGQTWDQIQPKDGY